MKEPRPSECFTWLVVVLIHMIVRLTGLSTYTDRLRAVLKEYHCIDYGDSVRFLEMYHEISSCIATADVQRAFHAISWLFVELCNLRKPLPKDLDPGNWIVEVHKKRMTNGLIG